MESPGPLLLVLFSCDRTLQNNTASKLVFFSFRGSEFLGLRKIIYLTFWWRVVAILIIDHGMEKTLPTKPVKATSYYTFYLFLRAWLLMCMYMYNFYCSNKISQLGSFTYRRSWTVWDLWEAWNSSLDIWITDILWITGASGIDNKEIENKKWFLIDALFSLSLQSLGFIWCLSLELDYISISREPFSTECLTEYH